MGLSGPLKPRQRTEADGKALAKTLSWPHLMALGIGGIIGTGIYTLTGVGAGLAGPYAGGLVNLPVVVVSLAVMGLLLVGARESATLSILLVNVKIVALGAFVCFGLPAIQAGHYDPFMPFGFLSKEIGGEKFGVMAASAIVFFAFFGFDAVSTAAEGPVFGARLFTAAAAT